MYGVLPEIPQSIVTTALKAFRMMTNSIPEQVHDRAFSRTPARCSPPPEGVWAPRATT
jgi:hypothetical protein